MSTLTSTARVPTDSPARCAEQLVSHLGRKVAFVEDEAPSTWTTTLGGATGTVQVADGAVVLGAAADDDEVLARVEHVLGSHLECGAKQELVVAWQRSA